MPDGAILDNDVLIKTSAYSIGREVTACLAPFGAASVLGVARFAVPKQVARSKRIKDIPAALTELALLLAGMSTVEPTADETDLAAIFEQHALEKGLPLDGGEGQILAIVATRTGYLMVTGDKRAITSVAAILSRAGRAGSCDARIACLEQLMMSILARMDPGGLRRRVCRELSVDTALAAAFSCYGDEPDAGGDAGLGLASYIENLRLSAGAVLYPGIGLSVVA